MTFCHPNNSINAAKSYSNMDKDDSMRGWGENRDHQASCQAAINHARGPLYSMHFIYPFPSRRRLLAAAAPLASGIWHMRSLSSG